MLLVDEEKMYHKTLQHKEMSKTELVPDSVTSPTVVSKVWIL